MEEETVYCAECNAVMIEDWDGSHQCPACDAHTDCGTALCAGDDDSAPCALRTRNP